MKRRYRPHLRKKVRRREIMTRLKPSKVKIKSQENQERRLK